MHHFPAGWSTKLKLSTVFFLGVLLFVSVVAKLVGTLIALGILGVTLAFSVRGYSLDGSTLFVHHLGWATKLDLRDLTDVEYEPDAMLGSIRTFGIGGLFGYTGHFKNETLGAYHAYVTDGTRTVVLRFGTKTVVVSPADPDAFMAGLTATQTP